MTILLIKWCKFKLKVTSKIKNLSKIQKFIHRVAQKLRLNEQVESDIQLAVEEAYTNIVQHAYEGKKEKVELNVEYQGDSFIVVFTDYGKMFEPEALPPPDLTSDIEERPIGGLGLYLIRQMMDEVKFTFDAEKGNKLTMVKQVAKYKGKLGA